MLLSDEFGLEMWVKGIGISFYVPPGEFSSFHRFGCLEPTFSMYGIIEQMDPNAFDVVTSILFSDAIIVSGKELEVEPNKSKTCKASFEPARATLVERNMSIVCCHDKLPSRMDGEWRVSPKSDPCNVRIWEFGNLGIWGRCVSDRRTSNPSLPS